MTFITHDKKIVSGKILQDAITKLKEDMVKTAHAIKEEDFYASHVTESEKKEYLEKSLLYAENLENNLNNFTTLQKLNTILTGECVALFAPHRLKANA